MSAPEPVILPADKPRPKRGEQAEMIRRLTDRNPKMPPSVIAKKVGCSPANVTQVLNRYVKSVTIEELDDFRANKVDILEAVQHKALASISEAHYANASFQQLVTGAAIIQDKLQLMNGLPTSIHVTALLDIADLLRKREDK